jgi:hypothetical protein
MSLATLDHVNASTAPTTTRRRRTIRKPATLTLAIGDETYAVKCFDIGDNPCGDGFSTDGLEHALIGPDGNRFQIFGCHDEEGDGANWCQSCMAYRCRHIDALVQVGLLCRV